MSRHNIQMKTIGQIIRNKRESLGLLLRQVAASLDIDPAILSKIERNERKPNKELILKLSETLDIDKEELLAQYISDKIAYDIADENCADRVLKLAEEKVQYLKTNSVNS
jgi:transcriptional regulator with XRE-family HTH domain